MDKKKHFHNIEQQRIESGKSVQDFCKDQGIRPSLYYYWRKKQMGKKGQKFHHINLASKGPGSDMRILYPNGIQVELYGEVNVAQIKSLIDVGL